jgi:hypothetical protein
MQEVRELDDRGIGSYRSAVLDDQRGRVHDQNRVVRP